MSDSTQGADGADDPRRLRRAEKAARKAHRAQEKADKARRDALEAVRASGFDVKDREDAEADTTAEADTNDADAKDVATDAPGANEARTKDAGTKDARKEGSGSKDSGKKDSDAKASGPGKFTLDGAAEGADDAGGDKDAPTSSAKRANERREPRPAPEKGGNPKLAAALLAIAAVLAVVAVVSWVGYGSQRDAVASEQAETNAPYEAADAARTIVTNMFTYDSDGVDEQLGRVEPQLTGEAEKEFRETTRPQVSSLAKETEANSYATVAAVGLEERIDSDHVVTVMMLNRMVSTKDNPEAQNSSTRLRVSVDRVDDGDGQVWKVSKVEVL